MSELDYEYMQQLLALCQAERDDAQKEVIRLRKRDVQWQQKEARLIRQLEQAEEKWLTWKSNSYALEQRLALTESQLKEERRRAIDAENRIIRMDVKNG